MKPFISALVLATALGLAGCESLGLPSLFGGDSEIVTACETATSALNVATVFKAQGKLTTAQIESIDDAVLIIRPICGAPVKPSSQQALDLVQSAVFALAGVNAAAGSN